MGRMRNNMINSPTDGGIVLFGAPDSIVENNTIWVTKDNLLGGINMVDVMPWGGDYSGTVVRNNTIIGGNLKSSTPSDGDIVNDVIVKIGIAIGPQTWFGEDYGANVSSSGTVLDNTFIGAFGYGISIASAHNFTVDGNVLLGNTAFMSTPGPNCSATWPIPASAPFIFDPANITSTTLQPDFQSVESGKVLVCVQPPHGGNYWPSDESPSQEHFDPPLQRNVTSTS